MSKRLTDLLKAGEAEAISMKREKDAARLQAVAVRLGLVTDSPNQANPVKERLAARLGAIQETEALPAEATDKVLARMAKWIEQGLYPHPAEVLLEIASGTSSLQDADGAPITQIIAPKVRVEAAKALLPYFEQTKKELADSKQGADRNMVSALNLILNTKNLDEPSE